MVTTLQECELYAAVATWITNNNVVANYRMLVEFPAFGHSDVNNKVEWRTVPNNLPTVQNLIDSYNSYLQTIENSNKTKSIDEVRSLLRNRILKELIADTVDTTVLKNELQTIINSNSQAATAFSRTATLWAIDTSTVLGYIRVCYLLTAIAD